MLKKRGLQTALALSLLVAVTSASAGKDCAGLTNILTNIPKSKPSSESGMWESLKALVGSGSDTESADCSSLTSVAGLIINRNRTSGRRLEDKKPLNIAQAQANLDKALSDPSIKTRLEKLKQQVSDDQARTFLEAAIFDEEGFYGARDLRIQQLTEKLK